MKDISANLGNCGWKWNFERSLKHSSIGIDPIGGCEGHSIKGGLRNQRGNDFDYIGIHCDILFPWPSVTSSAFRYRVIWTFTPVDVCLSRRRLDWQFMPASAGWHSDTSHLMRFWSFAYLCLSRHFPLSRGGGVDRKAALFPGGVAPGPGAIVAAIGIAVLSALAVMPHITGNSVSFGAPIFDHEKVAIIDEIVNNGIRRTIRSCLLPEPAMS